jgi:two-component system response regulator MprA
VAVRILVVDDDRAVRESLRRSLSFNGYSVSLAEDGVEALNAISSERPDALVLDVMMPKLDGLAVVDQLRKDHAAVLAHTYLLTAGQTAHLQELPVRGLIGKPFDIQTLLAETKDCIGH